MEHELRNRLLSEFEWRHIDTSTSNLDPLAFLLHKVCPDVSAFDAGSVTELAAHPSFQGKLIWVEKIDNEMWPAWSMFLKSYSDACRNIDLMSRTTFIVLLSGKAVANKVTQEAALVSYDFKSVVDALDLFVLALQEPKARSKHRGHRALLAHTVAQVAQWDTFLAAQLLALPLGEVLSPQNTLRQYASNRGWTSETPRYWENGTLDGPPEKPVVHSALLEVCGEARTVRRRIWMAQAAVLLPLVEEQRINLISQGGRYLNLPIEIEDGQQIEDPLDLGVGQLARHLLDQKGIPHKLKKKVRSLRVARNKLAHMEPLEPKEALRLIN